MPRGCEDKSLSFDKTKPVRVFDTPSNDRPPEPVNSIEECASNDRRLKERPRATVHQTVVGAFRGQKPNPSGKKRRVAWIPSPTPKETAYKTVVSDCGPRTAAHEAADFKYTHTRRAYCGLQFPRTGLMNSQAKLRLFGFWVS